VGGNPSLLSVSAKNLHASVDDLKDMFAQTELGSLTLPGSDSKVLLVERSDYSFSNCRAMARH